MAGARRTGGAGHLKTALARLRRHGDVVDPPALVDRVGDGTVRLEPEMIASETLRRWIAEEYATCYDVATRRQGC